MNQEHLRLLQAAVGGIGNDTYSVSQTSQEIDPDDVDLANLPADEIERLLAQLNSESAAPQPAKDYLGHECSSFENDDPDDLEAAVFGALQSVLRQDRLREAAQEISTNEVESYHSSVKEEEFYDDAQLAAAIENSIEELSREATRANSPHLQPSLQPSPAPKISHYGHSAEHSSTLEALTAILNGQSHGLISEDQSMDVPFGADNQSRGSSRRQSSNDQLAQHLEDLDDPTKAQERERIREENRERKKRWREVNQDRNKDNDLRCRVTKRASKLFGLNHSAEKQAWVQEEFFRRKTKREQKEKARTEGPSCNGNTGVFYKSQQGFQSGYGGSNDIQPKQIMAADVIQILTRSGRDGPAASTMEQLISYLVEHPRIFDDLAHMGTSLYGNTDIYPIINSSSNPQPPFPREESPLEETPTLTSFSFENIPDLPEGFDAIIADIQKSIAPVTKENIASEDPAKDLVDDIASKLENISEKELDELLAVLQATDNNEEAGLSEEVGGTGETAEFEDKIGTPTPTAAKDDNPGVEEDIFPTIADLSDIEKMGGMAEEMTEEMTEEMMNQLIAEKGFDLEMVDIDELLDSLNAEPESTENIDDFSTTSPLFRYGESFGANDSNVDDNGNTENHALNESDTNMDAEEQEIEGMTMEQINALLSELQDTIDESSNLPMEPQSPQNVFISASNVQSRSSSPGYGDYPVQYTSETVGAVLQSLLESLPRQLPPVPLPPTPSYRGSKRSSTGSFVPPPNKRMRGPSPNTSTPIAVTQLPGFLESSMDVKASSSAQISSAYTTSFGNSDSMNKRLIALKPPPYRPIPSASSSTTPTSINVAPPKKKEDEKKIKAMGFPPLMAGIKRN